MGPNGSLPRRRSRTRTRDEPLRTTAWEANQFLAVGPYFRVTVTTPKGG